MSLNNSYMPNYYSIEDILATQELVPCKILQNIPNLGILNPSSDAPDLSAETELELPLWLIQSVSTGRQSILKVKLPKIYKELHREVLKADASIIDLQKFNLYYYELGKYLCTFDPQTDEVTNCLEKAFQTRFCQLMDLCENIFINPNNVEKLELLERRIFLDSHEARLKLHKWLTEAKTTIKAADLIINQKKRKRIEIEVPN